MDPYAPGEFVLIYELDGAPHEFPLADERLVIGRARDCNLCFPFNTEVSRLHAALTATPDGWQVEDMSSRSGTFVNGQRLEGPRRLRDRDVLTIGTVALTLREKKHQLETVTGDVGLPDDLLAQAKAQAATGGPAPVAPKQETAPREHTGVPWEEPPSPQFEPQVPNYYELIGVPNFEANVARIQAAAKRQLGGLRAGATSDARAGHRAQIEAIASGLATLSSPEKKRLYDAQLAQQLGTEIELRGGQVVPVEPASFGQIVVGLILVGVAIAVIWFGLSWILNAIAPVLEMPG